MILGLCARPAADSEPAAAPSPSGQIVDAKNILRSTPMRRAQISM